MLRFLLIGLSAALLQASESPATIPLQDDLAEKRADPVQGSADGWTVRLDFDGYFPDEDVLIATSSPDFWQQGSGAFITKPPYLNGRERQKYHRVYIRSTGEDWTEQMITVVPDADGKLTITCYVVAPGAMNIVHWDDLRVEGATLDNGGFEDLAEDGSPRGWQLQGWNSEAPRGAVVHDPDDAAEGDSYVSASWTWHWNATLTDVVQGRPIVVRWKNRFVPVESRYPVRVGISGLDTSPAAAHTTFTVASGMRTDTASDERYSTRILSQLPRDELDTRYGAGTRYDDALAIYLSVDDEQWSERTIHIIPDADGELAITLQGARIRDRHAGMYRPVLIDYANIHVEGANLLRSGLVDEDADQVPDGWQRIGLDQQFSLLRNEGGQAFVRTWYHAGLRTTLHHVTAGQPITVTFQVRSPQGQ